MYSSRLEFCSAEITENVVSIQLDLVFAVFMSASSRTKTKPLIFLLRRFVNYEVVNAMIRLNRASFVFDELGISHLMDDVSSFDF